MAFDPTPQYQLSLWPDPTFDSQRTRRYRSTRRSPPKPGSLQWRHRRAELIVRQRYRCAGCSSQVRLYLHYLTADVLAGFHVGDGVMLCRRCSAKVCEAEDESHRLFRPCGVR